MKRSNLVPVIVVILVVAILAALVIIRPPALFGTPTATAVSAQDNTGSDDTTGSGKAVVEQLVAAIMQDDRDALLGLLAPDFAAHIPQNLMFDVSLDSSLLDEVTSIFHAAVPNLNIESQVLIEEGEYVAQRALLTGDFQGEFYDFPPNDSPIQFAANVIYRIAEGKIAELWIEFDQPVLLEQMEIS